MGGDNSSFTAIKYGQVTLSTGSLYVRLLEEWVGPVSFRQSSESILPGQCPSLSTVTDGTTILLNRMVAKKFAWMAGVWLRYICHAGILQSMVAGDTSVDPFKMRKVYLKNAFLKRHRSPQFLLIKLSF